MNALSLYIHIPFCRRKCPYCDFNTYAGIDSLHEPLAEALQLELQQAGLTQNHPAVKSIFFGGGTPTSLPTELLAAVLHTCRQAFDVLPSAEITCEANPDTADANSFAALRSMGVNRLSIGVQSFVDDELHLLGRLHDAAQARHAYTSARQAGFENINLDLMFGLPFQSSAHWQQTLTEAVALAPEHLSLYSLTVEAGTPWASWVSAGQLPPPDPDSAADLYELADQMLAPSGYVQYEISNWARDSRLLHSVPEPRAFSASPPEILENREELSKLSEGPLRTASPSDNPHYACRHNLTYWRNEAYLGFGPGAHSHLADERWANVNAVPDYIQRVAMSPVSFREKIPRRLAMGETMMLGLRLVREGVSLTRFETRHQQPLLTAFPSEVTALQSLGLIEYLPDRVRLTASGRLVGNQVFARFLPN
jgi:oxygen-independent coproporphyrinogen-3 oxidase